MAEDEGSQIQVQFTTKLAQYRVVDTPFAVPARLTRLGLSEVVNHLLALETPKPFDFLVNGEFLRTSLETYLAKKGLSSELVVVLEYVLVPPRPEPKSDYPHEDWVSSLSGELPGLILTGSFDKLGRVWSEAGEQQVVLEGHSDAVTSVAWLSKGEADVVDAVTASKDHTLRSWQICHSKGEGAPVARFVGHTDSVGAVASNSDGTMFVSGSWDKTVKLWAKPDAEALSTSAASAKKKRRGPGAAVKDRGPMSTLLGHTQCVSAVVWPTQSDIFTASWDHSVRGWDAETGVATTNLMGSKAITGLSHCASTKLLATSHTDRAVRLWDPRVSEGAVVRLTLSSHKGWVSGVSWAPSSSNVLASSSYDHSCRIWDIRSNVALHTLAGHEDKALCVGWASSTRVLSGGADGKVRSYEPKSE